jgi:hypothetical protein
MNHTQPSRKKLNGAVLVLMTLFVVVGVAAIVLFTKLTTASALPGDQANVDSLYPGLVGSKIDSCSLCHLGSPPALNAYGADYKAHGRSAAALIAIQNLDSDGDGISNLAEIKALSFPGDANIVPLAATSTDMPYPPPATPTVTDTLLPYPPPATSAPTQVPPTATQAPLTATATRTRTFVPTAKPTNTSAPTQGPTSTPTPTLEFTNVPPTQANTATPVPTQTISDTPQPTQVATDTLAPTQAPTAVGAVTLTATGRPPHATRTPTAVKTRRATRTPRPTRTVAPTSACQGRREDGFRNKCRTPRATRTLGPTPTGFCDFMPDDNCDDFSQFLGPFDGVTYSNLDLFFLPFKQMSGAYAGGRSGK